MIDYDYPIRTEFANGERMCEDFKYIINALRLLYHKLREKSSTKL